ncbi:MAG TPA: hypothetical protein VE011_09315 [Candidatus Dormibacteraeota bacterium]|nr:hypothetical protein [Candidatus Dormibacteraeota bacterium]
MGFVRAFFRFWYDFLVGDRWELFVGPIVALLLVWLAARMGLPGLASGVLLALLVATVGAISIGWAIRR